LVASRKLQESQILGKGHHPHVAARAMILFKDNQA
jgi:hypothetical protein